jgi:hypothetical protein
MRLHRAGYSLRLHDTFSAVARSGDRYSSGLEHGYNVLRYILTLKLSALYCTYVAQSYTFASLPSPALLSDVAARRRWLQRSPVCCNPLRQVRCQKLQDSLSAAARPGRQCRNVNVLTYNVLCCIVTSPRYDVILNTASILH